MTTSLPHTSATRRELSAWLAGIPYVIGFPPTDSLVLMTFRRSPTLVLGTTIRADLPAPEHVEAVAEQLISAVRQNDAVAAIAVVVGGALEEQRPLIAALREGFAANDILLVHASWVNQIHHGERWQCYLDPLCTDEIPDPQTSTLAVAAAIAGDPTYRTREEMAEQLTQDPPETLARREELLDAHLRTPTTPYTDDDLTADLALITRILTEAEESPGLPVLNDRQLVRLARALSHQEVKDECLAAALTPNPEAAERLWTVLTRALPAPERAEPAVLLGMSAYLRGAGTLAALAVRTALAANPAHPLAQLLCTALTQAAVPPRELRTLLLRSILKNEGLPDDLLSTAQPDAPHETEAGQAVADTSASAPAAPPDPVAEVVRPGAFGGDAEPPTARPPGKLRAPWSFARLRKNKTVDAAQPLPARQDTVPRKVVRGWAPLPEPTPPPAQRELDTRTAATLGLLSPVRTTPNPLTSFLPPQQDNDAARVRARNGPG